MSVRENIASNIKKNLTPKKTEPKPASSGTSLWDTAKSTGSKALSTAGQFIDMVRGKEPKSTYKP